MLYDGGGGAVQAPGRRGAFANNPSGVAILSLRCKHPHGTACGHWRDQRHQAKDLYGVVMLIIL